jgi:hypothetical protein
VDRDVGELARRGAHLLRRADQRRPCDLADGEHELVRLMLDKEVVREEDRSVVEVDPVEREAELFAGVQGDGHHLSQIGHGTRASSGLGGCANGAVA